MAGTKGKSKSGGSGKSTGAGPGGGSRQMTVTVKTAKRRKLSSTLWLQRQLNDPYVYEAKRLGYRSRAAFKIIQLDDRFHMLRPGLRVVDLGAAPGGWTQVAVQRVKAGQPKGGIVVGMDILEWDPVAGATVLQGDFLADDAPDRLKEALGGPADVVLSDMAAPTTGHPSTDHLRIIALVEVALHFAMEVLTPGGTFVAKVFQGGTEKSLLDLLKKNFATVRHAKPSASRAGSAETYVVAMGFRGQTEE
ncbi:RlmE family RNA methyltransferase [Magnetospirillum fulvum]|jgi:23S rRNA (uridine2552-2'-O)-methyltransferase|uniref:Ribosomal RNA large subunit methyltransferase E n=1 Tax=Magnetospirillum fulvum MGU-K5 TaxID=1316936 RepID=S9TX09_MAGFU|nr:RlmE family RNA methyltransferase [Magnetospirillum fulvum]EPY02940.1 23S rRNA methylase [Magnetospirillum fulvum MGU-K5]